MITYASEILFLFANIGIADYHASTFEKGLSINHTLWAAIVCVLIAAGWFVDDKNWLLALALLLERIWCFNPILNLCRGKPFFYTNSSKGGSWIDAHIGNSYPYIFIISLSGFIYLQFIL